MAEDFTDGTGDKPISWWMFEETASPSVDGNTTNANDLSWSTATRDTTSGHFAQGSSGLQATGNEATTNPRRALASLSANFPFLSTTTPYTIGGWVYAPSWVNDDVLHLFFNTNQGYGFSITGTGKVGHSVFGINNIDSDDTFPAGRNHIIARWNGDNRTGAGADDEVSLWVNGVKQATTFTTPTVNVVTAGQGLWFYSYPAQQPTFDEWFVFNVALLDTQIADIYAHGLDGTRNPPASRPMFRGS